MADIECCMEIFHGVVVLVLLFPHFFIVCNANLILMDIHKCEDVPIFWIPSLRKAGR